MNCKNPESLNAAESPTTRKSDIGFVALLAFFGGLAAIIITVFVAGAASSSTSGSRSYYDAQIRKYEMQKREIESEMAGHPPGGSLELLKERLEEVKKALAEARGDR